MEDKKSLNINITIDKTLYDKCVQQQLPTVSDVQDMQLAIKDGIIQEKNKMDNQNDSTINEIKVMLSKVLDCIENSYINNIKNNTSKIKHRMGLDQDENNWFPISTPPKKDGRYLVTIRSEYNSSYVGILSFTNDLYEVDPYDFYSLKGKSGWYDCSDDGHYVVEDDELDGWQYLPETSNFK